MANQSSIEIPWEDVISVVKQIGFIIEKNEDVTGVPYVENRTCSMMTVLYNCKFLVARKPDGK